MMADIVKHKNIKYEATLFEFIEPIVLLYRSGKTYYFASALSSNVGYVERYLVVSVNPKYFKKYFRQECDLRYLFASTPDRKYYIMSADDISSETIRVSEFREQVSEDMLPDSQFFATSHTSAYREKGQAFTGQSTVFIDGNWEMEDFGKFSSSYRDLYAYEESFAKLGDSNVSDGMKRKIGSAFEGAPLHGGASYVNLFRNLLETQPKSERYDLRKVEYASPGKIVLQGKASIFDEVNSQIETFLENNVELHKCYWRLRKFMSDNKLLDISNPAMRVPAEILSEVEKDAKELYKMMGSDDYEKVFDLTRKSRINTAKVAMALYRRVQSAATYFIEGRASFER